jgi:Flp pilus assembly protein TadG
MMDQRKQSGIAAVELAFILMPMLILCFGITEIGRAIYQYDGLIKSTRGAVRYLSQKNLSDPDVYSDSVDIAKSLAICGKQECTNSDSLLVPGLNNPAQIIVDKHPSVPTGEGTASLVSVTIGGIGNSAVNFRSAAPGTEWFLGNFSFSPVKITMAYSTT